ncbi:ferritin-like domain-containing protein [Paenibacillus faecalis]|uniref:ferritin-like domain-containing protein n=1 Tax=Paenibacillus faecalis TaxID=2079532 RepID=UPI003B3A525B
MYSHMPYTQPSVSPEFIRGLEQAINGEYSAILCYEQLGRMSPSAEQRNIIHEIRQDEIRHYRLFSQLYVSLTGRQHTPQITESCPNEYRAGLYFAFQDEQKTVDFYLGLSDIAPDINTRDLFRRAAADEQQHAVWFLSFLTLP